jgi:hypothetical protein
LPVAALVGRRLLRRLDPVGREDEAGVHAIHADVVFHHLVGEGLGEHHQRRFGDVVDRLVSKRLRGSDRSIGRSKH